jgi:hypothetical protein
MAFRKPPTVDVPKAIESYLDDVTMSGISMEALAKECVEEVLGVGRIGVLVDYPQQPGNVTALTVAAAQQMGLRPTLQLLHRREHPQLEVRRINNAWMLSMVVLAEKAAEGRVHRRGRIATACSTSTSPATTASACSASRTARTSRSTGTFTRCSTTSR